MKLTNRLRQKHLMRALQDKDFSVRYSALCALSDSKNSRESPALVDVFIQHLADPEAKVREVAAQALRYSVPVAIPALIKALGDTAPEVRVETLIALGSLDAEEAIEPMAACLHADPDEEVRSYAAVALKDIHSPRVAEHLIKALEDASARVRSNAASALRYANARSRFRRACASDEADEECHQPAVLALCKSLGDEDANVREEAAEALQSLLDCPLPDWDTALEPLCAAAHDPYVSVRAAAIEALGLSRNPRAHAIIVQALDDDECDVKAKAIESLGRIDPALCIEQVPRMLANPDASLQRAAARALQWTSDCALSPEVLSYFSDIGGDVFAREEIARVIATRGDPAYVPALLKALSTDVDYFRCSVIKALGAIPDRRALSTLIDCLQDQDSDVCAEAVLALAALGDEQAILPIGELVEDEVPSVRRRAIWALSFFEPAKAQALLVRGLEDEDENVQSTAVSALASICNSRSLRRIRSSLPRSQKEVKAQLEEAAEVLDRDWGGEPSAEARPIHLGTLHYE